MISASAKNKIIHLIGLIGSQYDTECLAAARGIARILHSEKASFGDLVTALGGSNEDDSDWTRSVVLARFEMLCAQSEKMQGHEYRFVWQVRDRMLADQDYALSPKQAAWFAQLCAKYLDEHRGHPDV